MTSTSHTAVEVQLSVTLNWSSGTYQTIPNRENLIDSGFCEELYKFYKLQGDDSITW
uniref:Uncharacterized protein n=1 Tax=Anguilla anguilla TaxID=7936 RepID=A0A0E9V9Y9_ANGAN